jgi:uncharacterized protein
MQTPTRWLCLSLAAALLAACAPPAPTELPPAFVQGDLEGARSELKANPRVVHAKDKAGNTPLHLAVARQKEPLVPLLLANGADPNAVNDLGHTPLFRAVTGGNLEIVRSLLGARARVNVRDPHQTTLLHAAARRGSRELIDLLVANGADPLATDGFQRQPILLAIMAGNAASVQAFLDHKVPVTAPGIAGGTLLHAAGGSESVRVAELLLERGGDLEALDAEGGTPLHSAALAGSVDMVKFLLAQKANPLAVDANQQSALERVKQLKGDARQPSHKEVEVLLARAMQAAGK